MRLRGAVIDSPRWGNKAVGLLLIQDLHTARLQAVGCVSLLRFQKAVIGRDRQVQD